MKKEIASILLGAALPLLAGPKCEADLGRIAEHFAVRGTPWTWLFYGDSITHGAVHTHGWRSFAEIFQERVRTELSYHLDCVINAGVDGSTSLHLVSDGFYDRLVRRHHPDVVLLLSGCNDIVHDECGGPEQFRERLTELTRRIRQDGAIPILQTYNTMQLVQDPSSPYLQGYVKRYNEFPAYNNVIREVAASEDTILVDHRKFWEENAAEPETLARWLAEPLHPGPYGHLQMAILSLKQLGIYSPDSKCCNVIPGN